MSFSNGFGQGFTRNSTGVGGGFNFGFFKATSSTPATGKLFTNFDTYIIDGSRLVHGTSFVANATEATIRSNIEHTRVLKVTETVTVQGFKFVRVPFYNWQVTSCVLNLTLSVVGGSGGSIDGNGAGTKTFTTNSVILKPATGRTTSDTLVGVNARPTEYDLITVYDATPVTLTAGSYQYAVKATDLANRSIAVLYTSKIPIPTTSNVYPDPDNATNATTYSVIEVLSTAP